jgi:HlyD family secretion protein
MKKIRLAFSILFVFAGVLTAAYLWMPKDTALASSAKIQNTVEAPATQLGIGAIGRIEPRSRVIRLSHDQGPEGARIEKVLVEEGQIVQAGDTLVLFSDYQRRQSELEMAKARLKAIEARLPGFHADLADAEAAYKRYQSLLDSAVISRASYDQTKARFQKAAADLNTARFDIETTKTEVRLAGQKMAQSILKAPMNGTVLKIHARQGERVTDSAIMEFADLTQLDVVAEVYENDIPRIQISLAADVILPGIEKKYAATVRERGFLVRKNDLNDTDPLADRDNRVVEVRLTLDNTAIDDLKHQILRQVQVQIKP